MRNRKLTLSLSDKTLEVLAALREITDAYTDSEVVKNALCFHLQSFPPESEIGIVRSRFVQPLKCKCGHALSCSDIRSAPEEKIEIVCSACHASVLEIECEHNYDIY